MWFSDKVYLQRYVIGTDRSVLLKFWSTVWKASYCSESKKEQNRTLKCSLPAPLEKNKVIFSFTKQGILFLAFSSLQNICSYQFATCTYPQMQVTKLYIFRQSFVYTRYNVHMHFLSILNSNSCSYWFTGCKIFWTVSYNQNWYSWVMQFILISLTCKSC